MHLDGLRTGLLLANGLRFCWSHTREDFNPRCKLQTANIRHFLRKMIACRAAADRSLTIADKKEQTRKCQQPDVVYFYGYKYGGNDVPEYNDLHICFKSVCIIIWPPRHTRKRSQWRPPAGNKMHLKMCRFELPCFMFTIHD